MAKKVAFMQIPFWIPTPEGKKCWPNSEMRLWHESSNHSSTNFGNFSGGIWCKMAAEKVSSVFRKGLFAGKTAIVTGGGTGIGCAIAQELLHLGNATSSYVCHSAFQTKKNLPLGDNRC